MVFKCPEMATKSKKKIDDDDDDDDHDDDHDDHDDHQNGPKIQIFKKVPDHS